MALIGHGYDSPRKVRPTKKAFQHYQLSSMKWNYDEADGIRDDVDIYDRSVISDQMKNLSMFHSKDYEIQAKKIKVSLMKTDHHQYFGKTHELSNQIQPKAPWYSLSDEIMLHLFSWLPKITLYHCALVCKKWNRIALDETLWRRIDLSGKVTDTRIINRLIERGVMVLRLSKSQINGNLYPNPTNTMNIRKRISKIHYLDLSMANITIEVLEDVLSNCIYLRKLSLANCFVNETCCRFISLNHNLDTLDLSMVEGLTHSNILLLMMRLENLESVNLSWCNLSRNAIHFITTKLPSTMLKLNLSGCKDNLCDEDIKKLCYACPHLKELDISDCSCLTSSSVAYIASSLKSLEYLALSRCYKISPASLPLLTNIEPLSALDIFSLLQEQYLEDVKRQMPQIQINRFLFSSIARPTTGIKRTSIWGLRVRDHVM